MLKKIKTIFIYKMIILGLSASLTLSAVAADSSNNATAIENFQTLQTFAKQGNVETQYHLGNLYYHGIGVKQDYTKAIEWYLKAADQDYADAQKSLGLMYAEGKGVPKDNAKAQEWYNKACENGDQESCDKFQQLR